MLVPYGLAEAKISLAAFNCVCEHIHFRSKNIFPN